MQLYAITSRLSLATDQTQRTSRLLELAADWAQGGVDYIQVREKDLDAGELESLVLGIVAAARQYPRPVKVLVNGDPSVAESTGADGVHLPGNLSPEAMAAAISSARRRLSSAIFSVACHSIGDVRQAREAGADLILFAPVFGKLLESGETRSGVGLNALGEACGAAGPVPVFALGGVTAANAASCISAGAAGIAAIRLFAAEDWRALAQDMPVESPQPR